jgi:hypothetical protein
MAESTSARAAWETFYVIVGSSGGALIGLQFVVITLIAERRHLATAGALSAFGTPTVVHFTCAVVVSAVMSAPWPSAPTLSLPVGVLGLGGLAYSVIVVRRARRQTTYEPVWADWLWYAILPGAGYAVLAGGCVFLQSSVELSLWVIAAATLGLLLVGIHNAWDTVMHIVVQGDNRK